MNRNREAYERELKERQRKHLESLQQANDAQWKPCMHDQCQQCHGTGISARGVCVHSVACDCPKCSAR